MNPSTINPATFLGGKSGKWKVRHIGAVVGEAISPVKCVDIYPSHSPPEGLEPAVWALRGTNVHVRYAEREEVNALSMRQPSLNRDEATFAALIPIRKSADWWNMPQDERRSVFERESQHISMSMDYLPAIARRLYQSRELGEPFDFLTWFEFAPENEHLFDDLLKKLRASREWEFVDREVDIRLILDNG